MATAEYRVLWLNLAKLTRQTGSVMCRTYSFFILYMFMKITLNLYWTINALFFVPSKPFVIIYICICIIGDIALMCVICDNAESVERKVNK